MSLLRNTSRVAFSSMKIAHGGLRPMTLCHTFRSHSSAPRDPDFELWGDAARKYQIHPETLSYARKMRDMKFRGHGDLPVELERGQMLRKSEVFGGQPQFTGSETELMISILVKEKSALVPVTVYKPVGVKRVPVIVVYFHGGGLVTGSRNTHATMLKTIARRCGCVVVNVEYRLAPEYKAPTAFYDCYCVIDWVLNNKVHVGGHLDSRVGVAGDGSGGHMVASIAYDIMGVSFEILVYPLTNLSLSAASFEEFANTPGFNTTGLKWLMSQFLESDAQRTDLLLCPSDRSAYAGVPSTLCILAQLDPLRDDCLAYCEQLKEKNMDLEVLMMEGAPHGFFSLPGHFQELTQKPYDKIVEFIRRFQ